MARKVLESLEKFYTTLYALQNFVLINYFIFRVYSIQFSCVIVSYYTSKRHKIITTQMRKNCSNILFAYTLSNYRNHRNDLRVLKGNHFM